MEKVDDDVRKLLKEMLETMYEAPGIGLAAIQVGILKIDIDISKEKKKKNYFSYKSRNNLQSEKNQFMRKAAYHYQANLLRSKDLQNVF